MIYTRMSGLMTHLTVPMEFSRHFQDYLEDRYDIETMVDDPEHTTYIDVDQDTVEAVDELLYETGIRHCVVTDLSAPDGLYQEDGAVDEERILADVEGAVAAYLADGGPVNTERFVP